MSSPRRSGALWALIVLLCAEAALLVAVLAVLVISLAGASPDSVASGVALAVLAAIAVAFVVAIVVGIVRGQAWSRSAAIVWQVLQLAVGIGAFQGAVAQPVWGVPLIAGAVACAVLLFTKPVVAATSGRASRNSGGES